MVIVCDVDSTVVDLFDYWSWWALNELEDDTYNTELEALYYTTTDPKLLEFWRQEDLYDDAEPLPHCVETLERWHNLGMKIVFASQLKGNHHKSKYNFLKRNFPFMEGFVGTKEKHYIDGDIIIDDRNSFINQFLNARPWCRAIKFNTPYTQSEELDKRHTRPDLNIIQYLDNWEEA